MSPQATDTDTPVEGGLSRLSAQSQCVDHILLWMLRVLAVITGGIVILIVLFLASESLLALQEIGIFRFVSDASWHPLSALYNILPMVVASLLVTVGAVVIACPLGIGSALFCRYYAPAPLRSLYRRMLELLAGIPSVVFGFWALVVLVPILGHGLLTATVIVACMIIPTLALIAESSFANVPAEYIRGSSALGLTRWAGIQRVIIPVARKGLLTAVVLATARAIGETMAVLMVCGNVVQMPDSLMAPVRTLTANIALEMSYASDLHRSALFVTGLFLMAVVGILMITVDRIRRASRI